VSPAGPKKIRVYEIAKDLKMSSDAVVEMIRALEIPVRSHMSTVDPNVVGLLREKMAEEKKVVKRDVARKQQAKESARAKPAEAVPPTATVIPPSAKAIPPAAKVVPPEAKAAAAESRTAAPEAKTVPAETKAAAPKVVPPRAPKVTPPAPPAEQPAAPRPPVPAETKKPPVAQPPRPPAVPRTPRRVVPRTPPPPAQRPPMAAGFKPPASGMRDLRQQRPRTGPGRRRDKKKKRVVDQKLVAESVRKTLASMEAGRGTRRRRRDRDADGAGAATETTQKIVSVPEFITVGELAGQMGEKPQEVLAACLNLGLMVNINRRLDKDSIVAVADEFEYGVNFVSEYGTDIVEDETEIQEEDLRDRPPVITVMGHVDHGKTSLLDYIRETNVIAGEAGGITQHIGAYQVLVQERRLTFLDTPGHEAFTAMRARGAQVTDIVVLVVAADDRVMPQTIEAIDHARAANVPIVVAVNKIDLPGANPELVKQELTRHNIVVEEFGGDIPVVPISAKQGTNIDKLLEILVLQADLLELKADPDRRSKGVVLEAKMERGRGIIPTVLVQQGTLRVGAPFVAGQAYGKVRAMQNERGQQVTEAGPSTPVEVLGWDSMPQAGDTFNAVAEEREAREVATKRQQLVREHEARPAPQITLADLHSQIQEGQVTELKLVIKGDVDGSVEALADQLGKLSSDEVRLKVIHQGVGRINEGDVLLASASNAIIIGFHVRPDPGARELANREKVDIRLYQVIYEAIDEVRSAMTGLLKPEIKETVQGSAEIRKVFQVSKSGAIAGCMVVAGKITRYSKARLIRNQDVIWEGELESLKRFKEDVRDVQSGFECGIKLNGMDEIKEGDIIEAYVLEEVARQTI
jgi:translation initiation factor IF-2